MTLTEKKKVNKAEKTKQLTQKVNKQYKTRQTNNKTKFWKKHKINRNKLSYLKTRVGYNIDKTKMKTKQNLIQKISITRRGKQKQDKILKKE